MGQVGGHARSAQEAYMGIQFSGAEKETLRSVQDMLLSEWEPLGVGVPMEDCNAYAIQALHRAQRKNSAEKIANYLTKVETEEMGLTLVPGVHERNLKVAERVIAIVGGSAD
jgi:hypothetical protein